MRFPPGCLAIALFLFLLILFPFFLADAMLTALGKLGLSPRTTVVIALGILFGGMVNIPVRRIKRKTPLEIDPLRMFGISRMLGPDPKQLEYMTLSVNLGGCLIPSALSLYEINRMTSIGSEVLLVCMALTMLNVWICYRMAQPVPQMGIAMNPLVPALTAAVGALLLAPAHAPSVAFVAGVLGPLIGADLLHLGEIEKLQTGMASIGGAGTFDGIVLSGLVAVLLA